MKNTFLKLSFLLALVFGIMALPSCNKDKDDDNNNSPNNPSSLVGTWNFNEVTVDLKAGGMNLADYLVNNLGYTQEQAQWFYESFETAIESSMTGTLTFNNDNTYHVDTPEDDESGTWAYIGNTLTLTHDEGTDNLTVVSLTSNTMILKLPTETEMVDFDGDDIDETELTIDMQLKLVR